MNIQVILTVTVLLTLALAVGAPTIASAQVLGTDPKTLEEVLKLQEYTISVSPPNDQPDPHFMFIGIMIVTFIGLGIIAAVFFIKGRSGKYTTIGR